MMTLRTELCNVSPQLVTPRTEPCNLSPKLLLLKTVERSSGVVGNISIAVQENMCSWEIFLYPYMSSAVLEKSLYCCTYRTICVVVKYSYFCVVLTGRKYFYCCAGKFVYYGNNLIAVLEGVLHSET
jgi:hypothetical protein